MNRYATTGVAARDLGVSTATLTRWVTSGRVIPAETTAGGHYRWDLPALRAQVRRIPHPHAERGTRAFAEDIARVVHAAERELQIIQGDPAPAAPWDQAAEYQIRQVVAGVELALLGVTPAQSHEAWCDRMRAEGWTYGAEKDETARTHPCLVPFAELPTEQQQKDVLFIAIVRALGGGTVQG